MWRVVARWARPPDRSARAIIHRARASARAQAPIWGAIADRTGKHREVLLFAFVGAVFARFAICTRREVGWMMPLVLVTAILNAPVRPLLDSAVINLLPDPSKYGKIRLWGQCGFGLGSSSVGPLLTSDNFGYEAVFVVHVLLALPTLMMMHLALSAPAKPAPPARITVTVSGDVPASLPSASDEKKKKKDVTDKNGDDDAVPVVEVDGMVEDVAEDDDKL